MFARQRFLILTMSNVLIFSFITCALGVISKKTLPKPRSQRFTPITSCRSFIALALTFRSMIYFKYIFMCGVRWGSKFILLHVDIVAPEPFVENTLISPIELSWHLHQKAIDHKHKNFFLVS